MTKRGETDEQQSAQNLIDALSQMESAIQFDQLAQYRENIYDKVYGNPANLEAISQKQNSSLQQQDLITSPLMIDHFLAMHNRICADQLCEKRVMPFSLSCKCKQILCMVATQ
ncbi:MAG: hypothetical protein EZS28_027116 [Streblomastix strix]|uniref:Uncharacterized protein n=1 Tax=Streblomastix strix TaxID=222440 RepID=A0A5J4V3N6_9EUKA|nr:MAG: hypothetical protein EZS28_027116 [Streblomastix strix]